MSIRPLSSLILSLLLTFSLILTLHTELVESVPTTIIVPDDYSSIQEAINTANAGDTVFVKNGTYPGNIIVNKTIMLWGENRETTIINASAFEHAILVESNNVTIRGFTICDSLKFGVRITSSGCHVLENNAVRNRMPGILLDGRAASVHDNTILNNYVADGGECGILLWNAYNNLVDFNIVKKNWNGILLNADASMNVIEHNKVIDNQDSGIWLNLGSCNNIIANNDIFSNGLKDRLFQAGIVLLLQSRDNQIESNNICNNYFAIFQDSWAHNNTIYHNNFINNIKQVYRDRSVFNIWDDGYPSGGNYWDIYNGTDLYSGPCQNITGSDGIGDFSHVINNENVDRYPLMKPFTFPTGDLNEDSKVDMKDVGIAAKAFGSHLGQPRWSSIADMNEDDQINMKDIALVARNFGKTHLDTDIIIITNSFIHPSDDSWVGREALIDDEFVNTTDWNFGNKTALIVSTTYTDDRERRVFLKFSLSSITSPEDVISARLFLYETGEHPSGWFGMGNIEAKAVTDDVWTEENVTWNNQPTHGSLLDTTHIYHHSAGWYSWDLTSFILDEFAGDQVASICLIAENENLGEPYRWSSFYSKEYDGFDPYLLITLIDS